MLDVCLLGTSGMLPMPGRYLTALMTRYNGSSMLIDCGEATQMAIKEKGWSFQSDRHYMFYSLSRRPHKRLAGTVAYNRKFRQKRPGNVNWA